MFPLFEKGDAKSLTLSSCYFHIHFHLIPRVEVSDMYEQCEETVP